jgi:integrase
VLTALGTALRRGELVGLRWRAVNLLEAKIEVRETFVRGQFTTPKSRASRRVVELGRRTLAVLEERWRCTAYRADDDLVFGHPTKGTPLKTGKLGKRYLRPALARAGIEKPFRPFHDRRHTSLTHAAAAGDPQIYVQARAGHSQDSFTERYMHAAQVLSGQRPPFRSLRQRCVRGREKIRDVPPAGLDRGWTEFAEERVGRPGCEGADMEGS